MKRLQKKLKLMDLLKRISNCLQKNKRMLFLISKSYFWFPLPYTFIRVTRSHVDKTLEARLRLEQVVDIDEVGGVGGQEVKDSLG